jgi:lysophospholipase L1-like esterase
MRKIFFWGLLPVVLPQAIYVRKKAPRFPAANGSTRGVFGTGKEFRLVAIGDSIIAGVGATTLSNALVGQTAEQLSYLLGCKIAWNAVGRIGADSKQVIEDLIPQLPRQSAEFMILSVGVNDATSLSRVPGWRENLVKILDALRSHSPRAIIAVAGIPPLKDFPLLPQPLRAWLGMRGEILDRTARDEIKRHENAIYMPLGFEVKPESFSADGFHPSEESYRALGEMMARGIAGRFKMIASKL